MNWRFLLKAVGVMIVAIPVFGATAQPETKSAKSGIQPADIFRRTNIWNVHLRFTAEQWQMMEPKPQNSRGPRRPGQSPLQGPEGKRNGVAAAMMGVNFAYVHADLEFGTNHFKDVGVRYKGNGTFLSSYDIPKRSLKIDLNQFVKGQKFGGLSQFNLHNSVRDPSSMNEAVAYRLFRDGGVPAPLTAYAKVFVTVPGKYEHKYFGLYTMVEDVGSAFAKEHFGTAKGAILKPVTPNLFADLGNDWTDYNQTYDPKGDLSADEKKRIIEFCKFATKADDAAFAAKLADFIDLDNFSRYMALTTWLCDLDGILGLGQNYYLYLHPTTHKFIFIPWDQDQTFGTFPRGSSEKQRENLSIRKPWSGQNRFLERVFKTDSFQKPFLARMDEFNRTILRPEPIHQQVEELTQVLRAPMQEESPNRLAEFNKAAAGEKVTIYMGAFGSEDGTLVKPIKSFVVARGQSVSDQLTGKSQGQTINSGF